jgi:glycosyltransferase involved in cell wall biosynthesis
MVKFEQLNNTHFVGYKCLIDKNSYNHITITSKRNFMQVSIVVMDVEASPGKYNICLNISTKNQLYWYGTYDNANKYIINNGVNKFIVTIANKQIKPFTIGIFANAIPAGNSVTIYSIAVNKLSDNEPMIPTSVNTGRGLNNAPINNKPTNNKPANNKPINNKPTNNTPTTNKPFLPNPPAIKIDTPTPNTLFFINKKNQKNILLVADVNNWCFDNIANIIKKYYHHNYNIYIEYCMNNPDYQKFNGIYFDLIIKFWYGYDNIDPFVIFPSALKAICIYDYIHWNNKITKYMDTTIYKNFIKNITTANFILYSCPIIKTLLEEQHPSIIFDKKIFLACDGVDIDKFYYVPYIPHNKLVVGWVGNTFITNKNFQIVSRLLGNVDWIEFVVQDKKNAIPHDQMPQFYHKIDVIVCLSNAEGTPNPILEASACGRTWVSTNVGIVELLYNLAEFDIKPGLIIENQNYLLPKLKYLYDNKNIMYQMGKLAREYVVNHFSWEKRVRPFGDIFSMIGATDNLNLSSGTNSKISDAEIVSIEPVTITPIVIDTAHIVNNIVSLPNKIIVTSTQYPRYGGAATCAYELHKYLIEKNMPSVCIFFDNSVKNNTKLLNPNNLPNVYNENMPQDHETLQQCQYHNIANIVQSIHGPEPYIIYSFNYFAPIISKYIFKNSMVYYMITGCNYINNENLIDTTNFLNTQIDIQEKNSIEKITVKISDVIVPNSDLTKNIFEHCYKTNIDDFVDMHEIFNINGSQPNNINRVYDITFVCSDYKRKVKNVDFVNLIYQNKNLVSCNKICVGKNSNNIIGTNTPEKIFCKELIPQEEIISILNNSKIVLVTSLIETYSITAVEATKCGCIVLASKNAACSSTINKFFVLDSYDTNEWVNKINIILNNYHYFKKIFNNNFDRSVPISYLWNSNSLIVKRNINIICCSVDTPYIGGCATNMYRIIKNLSTEKYFNIYGIFISNNKSDANPEKLNNIFKIPYDVNTEKNLLYLKNNILSAANYIDFIFFKNYKIFPFIQKVFKGTKIIFSPSGLRNISGNTSKEYFLDMNIKNIFFKSNINLINMDNIYQFAQKNDIYLDDYALKQSDMVIPNSLLSYNIIDNIYPNMPNLQYPIYFTNIIYNNTNDDVLKDRMYDVMFCAYDWNRKCKNYQMVLNILNHNETKNYKFIIIGKSQIAQYNHNSIVKYEYLSNDKVIDFLKISKVLVIPSKFDSNPNVLIEAIISGCNVVTSKNVGNSENLDSICIVEDYYNVDAWIKTINQCLHTRYEYKGPKQSKIISSIKKLFTDNKNYRKSVAVYKIPPELNTLVNSSTFLKPIYFNYIKATNTEFVEEIINYDIYFGLFVEISKKENCSNINYILYDSTLLENIYVNVNQIYPIFPKGVIIWKLKDIDSFSYFTNADLYFIRGTYYNFFQHLIPNFAKTIFYPATAMKQLLNDNIGRGPHPEVPSLALASRGQCLLTPQKFNIVLHHEDSNYNNIYNADRYVIFNKFTSDKFVCYGKMREYDFCYIATENQLTKNHDLFLNFLLYLENIKRTSNIIYVGNLEKIIADNKMPSMKETLHHVNLINKTFCKKNELAEIYNKSKINILFSGRDALPRVVSESAACGCFNIALDTLSDGKSFYDGNFGILIGDDTVKKILKQSSSVSYVSDPKLWEKIIPYMDKAFNHSDISAKFKEKYNIDCILKDIYG